MRIIKSKQDEVFKNNILNNMSFRQLQLLDATLDILSSTSYNRLNVEDKKIVSVIALKTKTP